MPNTPTPKEELEQLLTFARDGADRGSPVSTNLILKAARELAIHRQLLLPEQILSSIETTAYTRSVDHQLAFARDYASRKNVCEMYTLLDRARGEATKAGIELPEQGKIKQLGEQYTAKPSEENHALLLSTLDDYIKTYSNSQKENTPRQHL